MNNPDIPTAIDTARRKLGFLTLNQTSALATRGIVIPDPGSVLISPDVILGSDVVIWPNVTLQCLRGGTIEIGERAILHSGVRIAADAGRIEIATDVEIGDEGGFTIQTGTELDHIRIGAGARLFGGGSLSLSNEIGKGAQILGPIRAQNCQLGDGETHRHPEPDERGGVLKGAGVARDITVPKGHVIQAFGLFADAPMRTQSFFHPKPG
jgi:carbonic anhydrase/acetyltransferase-like protein (isoleucine patch superfamily)